MKKRGYQKEAGQRQRRKRMALLGVFFLLGFTTVIYRCIYLHIAHDPKLERIAQSQYRTKIDEIPQRGNIYDANLEELAVSVPNYSVAVRPGKMKDRTESLKKLSQILNWSVHDVGEKLDPAKKYVWLKRDLTPREKDRLSESQIDGVELVKGAKRYYPNREVASQILGAVGRENEGLGGLELFYDRYLRGGEEKSLAFRDARGKTFETEETLKDIPAEANHLHLTLRKNIQYVAESELNAVCNEFSAKSCTAIVMDPTTGAILAMASYPNFNPNSYQNSNIDSWRNIAVTDTFEPGSTFKVIMAASALESGTVKPTDHFFCENGIYQIGNHTIHDHEKYGSLSLREILKVSSNIGIYKVGTRVGKKTFSQIIDLFGFGKKTGIDYPGEASGYIRPASAWQEIEFANAAFGQGVRITPLQLATGFAAIANGGVRMRPYLVSEVTDAQGHIMIETTPRALMRVLSEDNARLLIDMMTEVTEQGGTATKAALPGYNVAGKTGTAQKFVNGEYSHTKFISSFVGIVPQESPKLVVLVTIDEPKGVIYGGLVAAPVFRKIAWAALRDLGVPPEKSMIHPKINKGPTVAAVYPQPQGQSSKLNSLITQASFMEPSNLGLNFGSGHGAEMTPDFRGLSKRKVLSMLDEMGVRGEIVGSGIAVSQMPGPGSPLQKGAVCRVYFKSE